MAKEKYLDICVKNQKVVLPLVIYISFRDAMNCSCNAVTSRPIKKAGPFFFIYILLDRKRAGQNVKIKMCASHQSTSFSAVQLGKKLILVRPFSDSIHREKNKDNMKDKSMTV